MSVVTNTTIASTGASQDLLTANALRGFLEIFAVDADVWVNFGADAAVDTGFLIKSGTSMRWTRAEFADITQRIAVTGTATKKVAAIYGNGSGEF